MKGRLDNGYVYRNCYKNDHWFNWCLHVNLFDRKKTISELTPFDILYVIILGAIIEEAIYDDKVSVLHVIFRLYFGDFLFSG